MPWVFDVAHEILAALEREGCQLRLRRACRRGRSLAARGRRREAETVSTQRVVCSVREQFRYV